MWARASRSCRVFENRFPENFVKEETKASDGREARRPVAASDYCGGGGGVEVAPGVIWVPITSPDTIISTRRFSFLPAAVLLSATGSALPSPRAITLLMETLLSTR